MCECQSDAVRRQTQTSAEAVDGDAMAMRPDSGGRVACRVVGGEISAQSPPPALRNGESMDALEMRADGAIVSSP